MDASEGPQRRLIIKEMVLENFKSYAGEQRVGPFHKVGTSSMMATLIWCYAGGTLRLPSR